MIKNSRWIRLLLALCGAGLFFAASPSWGEEADEALSRVLLLGDSMMEGVVPYIRTRLDGIASVSFMAWDRSRDALPVMEKALEDDPWDVMVMQVGLMDLKGSENQPAVSLDEYERHLVALFDQWLATSPSYKIFVTLPPVPDGVDGWSAGKEKAYNEVAVQLLRGRLITLEDVYERLNQRPDMFVAGSIELTEGGKAYLAMLISEAIEDGL